MELGKVVLLKYSNVHFYKSAITDALGCILLGVQKGILQKLLDILLMVDIQK
jgi:hypothetical protein